MLDFVLKYWLEVVFAAIVAVTTAGYKKLSTRLKSQVEKQDAVGLGVQALLRDRIIQAYNHYHEKGYCPIYALENVQSMYTQYHALGGNGTITELVERMKEMPSEPPEEKSPAGQH